VSQRFPVRNAKEVVKVLRKHGFELVGQSGSHQKWRHANGRRVIVAMQAANPFPSAH
jgi:predicted RNA binding protein YcfA (HicA-like mRNA interferase family)